MIRKIFTISILALSFNQNAFAETKSVAQANIDSKQINWPGFIAQSFENQGLQCYEVVKTETDKSQKPIPMTFIDNSRFISCVDSKKDITKSGNRYVTVTGAVIGTVDNDNYEYPVVMADKIRKWSYNHFDTKSVGTIKPRFSRSRLDFLINNNGF